MITINKIIDNKASKQEIEEYIRSCDSYTLEMYQKIQKNSTFNMKFKKGIDTELRKRKINKLNYDRIKE